MLLHSAKTPKLLRIFPVTGPRVAVHGLLIEVKPIAPTGVFMETTLLIAVLEIAKRTKCRRIPLNRRTIKSSAHKANTQCIMIQPIFTPIDIPIMHQRLAKGTVHIRCNLRKLRIAGLFCQVMSIVGYIEERGQEFIGYRCETIDLTSGFIYRLLLRRIERNQTIGQTFRHIHDTVDLIRTNQFVVSVPPFTGIVVLITILPIRRDTLKHLRHGVLCIAFIHQSAHEFCQHLAPATQQMRRGTYIIRAVTYLRQRFYIAHEAIMEEDSVQSRSAGGLDGCI